MNGNSTNYTMQLEDETCYRITDEYIGQVTLKAHESYLRVNVQKGI